MYDQQNLLFVHSQIRALDPLVQEAIAERADYLRKLVAGCPVKDVFHFAMALVMAEHLARVDKTQ